MNLEDSFITNNLKKVRVESYIFWLVLVIYYFFWVFNPSNKVITLTLVGVVPSLMYAKIKNLQLSLLYTYLVSTIIFSGKVYQLEVFPPGFFDEYLFPDGVVNNLIINSGHIILGFMFVILFRDFCLGKLNKITILPSDIFITLFFLWTIVSDYFGSNWVNYSLLLNVFGMGLIIVYFFVRFYAKKFPKNFVPIIFIIISTQVLFESSIALRQLIAGSPLSKNIESTVGIDADQFGLSADELDLRFRPMGTFGHANSFGMWLGFQLSILITVFFLNKGFKQFRNYLLLSLLFGIVALTVTLSRSAWLGFFISVLFILFVWEKVRKQKINTFSFKGNKILFNIITLIIVFIFIVPRVMNSLDTFSSGTGYFRIEQLREVKALNLANPIFGVGTGMFLFESINLLPDGYYSQIGLVVHNWYLYLVSEQGLPSIFLFFLYIVYNFKKSIRRLNYSYKSNFNYYILNLGILAGTISSIVIALFQPFIAFDSIVLGFAILDSVNKEET